MNAILIAIAVAIVVRCLLSNKQTRNVTRVVPYVASDRQESFSEVSAERSRRYW